MESGNALRIGAILALFLGAIYVLLPTFLQADSEADLAARAQQVDSPQASRSSALDALFAVRDGDPQLRAAQARDALTRAGVGIRDVRVEDGKVLVSLKPGTSKEQVVAALAQRPKLKLFALGSVGKPEVAEGATVSSLLAPHGDAVYQKAAPVLGEDAALAARLADVLANGVSADATDIGALVNPAGWDADNHSIVFGSVPAEPLGLVVVTVDGQVAGLGTTLVLGELASLDVATVGEGSALLATTEAPAVGDALTLEVAPAATEAPAAATPAEDDGSVAVATAPSWFIGLLPDTKMPLGLDLQGGIDLTLQVELDQAVMSRVNRDKAGLIQDIEETFAEGGTGAASGGGGFFATLFGGPERPAGELDAAWRDTRVRADLDRPRIYVDTTLALGDVQDFVLSRLESYTYAETDAGENGRQIHVYEMREDAVANMGNEAVDQVLDTLRRRIDETGVKEPTIVKKGGGRINVQLPGKVDLQSAVDAIGTTAVLEFLLVDEELEETLQAAGLPLRRPDQLEAEARTALPADQFADDELVNRWLWANNMLPENRVLRWNYEEDGNKQLSRTWPVVLKVDNNPLTGSDVDDASVGFDQTQQPLVLLSFKRRGADKFCELTSANINKRFAILLDDKVMSAPNIRSAICGGRAQIEMGGSQDPTQEAKTLSVVLRTGSLNAPVTVGDVRIVGPNLGHDSIRAGSIAIVIGSTLVLLFMALWYRTAGLIADFALVVNITLMLAILSLFGATLTLPGLAGIALTVGMAVDANIIIYERIREELRLGQHARKAVDAGFDKAAVAVIDANVTTAVAGIVLYSYGTGPIKGFAVTLLIGIVTTLIASLFVNRSLMEMLTRSSSARLRI